MKRSPILEGLVLVVLVVSGVALRLLFRDLPNFAPVAALAMFSGFFFRGWLVALSAPLMVMSLSNLVIGGYHPALMVAVYGMLALPVAMRGLLRSQFNVGAPRRKGKLRQAIGAATILLACGITSSIAFFTVTNAAVWFTGGLYPLTLNGLADCYVQAIPFFRYTLAGDAFFALLFFGVYSLVVSVASSSAYPLPLHAGTLEGGPGGPGRPPGDFDSGPGMPNAVSS